MQSALDHNFLIFIAKFKIGFSLQQVKNYSKFEIPTYSQIKLFT